MTQLRQALGAVVVAFALAWSTAAMAFIGPLPIKPPAGGGGGGCTPSAPALADLPQHFMVGAQTMTSTAGYMNGMGVAWDVAYEYLNGPTSLVAQPGCSGNWPSPNQNIVSGWQVVASSGTIGCGSFAYDFLTTYQPVTNAVLFTYYGVEGDVVAYGTGGGQELQWLSGTLNGRQNILWYLDDYVRLLQIINTYGNGKPVIIQIEPDFNGFMENGPKTATTSVPGIANYVGPGGFALSGLVTNTLAGLYQAYVVLRNHYAPVLNGSGGHIVKLMWQFTQWAGSGGAYVPVNHNASLAVSAGNVVAAWYQSMFAGTPYAFDMANFEFSDMDSGYYKKYCAANSSGMREWYDLGAFTNLASWVSTIHTATGLKFVGWQIPSGNTVYKTLNNTDMHFQDDRAQYLLQPTNPYLATYTNAGVIGAFFAQDQQGQGAQCGPPNSGTDPFDYKGDGTTNPAAIGIPTQAQNIVSGNTNNTMTSVDADDDGGYIRHNAGFAQAAAVCP